MITITMASLFLCLYLAELEFFFSFWPTPSFRETKGNGTVFIRFF